MIIEPLVLFQISGNIKIIVNDGTIYDIDKLPLTDNNYATPEFYRARLSYLLSIVNTTFLKHYQKPYMVFANCLSIPQFSTVELNEDIREIIKQEGLEIYLTELLTQYTNTERLTLHKGNIASLNDLGNYVVNSNINDNVSLNIFYNNLTNVEQMRCMQFDSIYDLITNNQLSNVSVHTVEDNVPEFYSNRYPGVTFFVKDLFLLQHLKDFIDFKPPVIGKITYNFICVNWRYTYIRHILMTYLMQYNGIYSWYFKGSIENLKTGFWFNIEDFSYYTDIQQGLEILNNLAPLSLDNDVPDTKTIEGKFNDIFLLPANHIPKFLENDLIKDGFCMIVTEAEFTILTANFSEKTLLAVRHKKPFILVGQPKSLAYLKKYGFKTFSDFWDESYDDEFVHKKRLEKIFDTIKYIGNLDINRLNDLYLKMQDIIEHNYELLAKITNQTDLNFNNE